MSSVKRFRVWCETESAHVRTWATTAPTTCPNDAGHTITAAKTAATESRPTEHIAVDPIIEPVVPGSSKCIANDRPAIEVQNGITGFGAIQTVWPHEQNDAANVDVALAFILKSSGTGSNVRIAARIKADGDGDDSTGAFADTDFVVVVVTHTTTGEVFSGKVTLDASSFAKGDAVALHVGRDGNNELGAGTNDNCNVPVQLIAVHAEAF